MSVLPELLASHFSYTRHASALLLEAAKTLTPEGLTRSASMWSHSANTALRRRSTDLAYFYRS